MSEKCAVLMALICHLPSQSAAMFFSLVTTLISVAVLRNNNDSCLTPAQDKTLTTVVKVTHGVLATAVISLDIAAVAEKNVTTQKDLELAATIVSTLNKDIVGNLTYIAEEACGTCKQIVHCVDDSCEAVEEALERIEPDWKTNPIFEAVVTAVNAVLSIAADICPNASTTNAAHYE
tara:strand:+ start:136 stop:666 length:531 start_codon:yes stop_codon:yes gene_type:complete